MGQNNRETWAGPASACPGEGGLVQGTEQWQVPAGSRSSRPVSGHQAGGRASMASRHAQSPHTVPKPKRRCCISALQSESGSLHWFLSMRSYLFTGCLLFKATLGVFMLLSSCCCDGCIAVEKKRGRGGKMGKKEEERQGRKGRGKGEVAGREDIWKDIEKSLFTDTEISILLVSSWETEKQLEQDLKGQMA